MVTVDPGAHQRRSSAAESIQPKSVAKAPQTARADVQQKATTLVRQILWKVPLDAREQQNKMKFVYII
jgi:hypothetical protein